MISASGVERFHLRPLFGLRVLDEREHLCREQRQILVPLRVVAGLPAATSQ